MFSAASLYPTVSVCNSNDPFSKYIRGLLKSVFPLISAEIGCRKIRKYGLCFRSVPSLCMYRNLNEMMKLTVFLKASEPWPMFSYARHGQITTQVSRKVVLENDGLDS